MGLQSRGQPPGSLPKVPDTGEPLTGGGECWLDPLPGWDPCGLKQIPEAGWEFAPFFPAVLLSVPFPLVIAGLLPRGPTPPPAVLLPWPWVAGGAAAA